LLQAAEPLRLFFALWPPKELQGRLAAWADSAAGRGRAMRRENIHLTLAFLGATDPALLPELKALAAGVRFDAFHLALERIGYWKHNRIIWCGASEEPDALTALVADLRAQLDAAGMRYDPKPFVSHVTLVRNAAGLPAAPAWVPLAWEVRDFTLVVSNSVEGRVSYQLLQRFPAAAD
jgi:2'-5' RNA ligase